jgi:hypothetical protein
LIKTVPGVGYMIREPDRQNGEGDGLAEASP